MTEYSPRWTSDREGYHLTLPDGRQERVLDRGRWWEWNGQRYDKLVDACAAAERGER